MYFCWIKKGTASAQLFFWYYSVTHKQNTWWHLGAFQQKIFGQLQLALQKKGVKVDDVEEETEARATFIWQIQWREKWYKNKQMKLKLKCRYQNWYPNQKLLWSSSMNGSIQCVWQCRTQTIIEERYKEKTGNTFSNAVLEQCKIHVLVGIAWLGPLVTLRKRSVLILNTFWTSHNFYAFQFL